MSSSRRISQQLSLPIMPQRAVYRADLFVVHVGLREIVHSVREAAEQAEYHPTVIRGRSRSGKTHLAVRLCEEISQVGRYPRMLSGVELGELLAAPLERQPLRGDEVLVVDDADQYLETVTPGGSGAFVGLVESMRGLGTQLVLCSTAEIAELPCDEHVITRLRAGGVYEIGTPDENEMPALVERLSRSRGFQFSEREIDFLVRRLNRTVPAVEEYLEKLLHLSSVLGKKVDFTLLGDAL